MKFMLKLNAYEMNTIYDIIIEEIDTLARRIINAPTKDIRAEHKKQRNKLLAIAEKLEVELQIETYR